MVRLIDPVSARVSVRSGHKVGKSCAIDTVGLWWVTTRKDGKCVMTSSSDSQVQNILWPEVLKLYYGAKYNLGGRMLQSARGGWRHADGRALWGFSTDRPDNMAGISGSQLLFLADEASGIPNSIFEAIEGNCAGGSGIVMFSNPLRPSGYFYDSHSKKSRFWKTMRISSRETPNAMGTGNIPGLAIPKYIDDMVAKWGEDSAFVAVRIDGDFPAEGSNSVCGLKLVEAAMSRTAPAEGQLVYGLDVAEMGDDTSVLTARRGRCVFPQMEFRKTDGPDLAGQVLVDVRKRRKPGEVPDVFVDALGVGVGPLGVLTRSNEVRTHCIKVSERAYDEIAYTNQRAEIYFGMREALKEAALPQSDALKEELIAPTYLFDARGRLQVIAKKFIKESLGRSPDHSESLMLCLMAPAPRAEATIAVSNRYNGRGRG